MRNKLWFRTLGTIKNAACDVGDQDFSSVYKCQEYCRKCESCRFFQYHKDSSNFVDCNFFETNKEEVKGRALVENNNLYTDTQENMDYEFVVNGPGVCGKPIFSYFMMLSNPRFVSYSTKN